jgi:hypothetical protein
MDIDKTKFSKTVMVPFSGQTFTIRRVRFKDFLQDLGGLALPMAEATQDVISQYMEKAKSDPEAENKALRFYISKGTISPKVWFGEEAECPPDQIYHLDLGSDLDVLATEIMKYSYGMAMSQLENFFFQQAGTGDNGLDGTPVRPEAIEPSA